MKVRRSGLTASRRSPERLVLKPHQERAKAHVLERLRKGLGVRLFMRMRLGKTLVAIRALSEHAPRKVLVVAPLSVLDSWEKELRRDGLPPVVLHGPERRWRPNLLSSPNVWYLANYERVRQSPWIAELPWDAVILDESTRIRNPQAQITKLCLRAFQHVPHRFVLTGVPNPEGPLDFFTQMQFSSPDFRWLGCDSYWEFRNKYFRNFGYDWVPKPRAIQFIHDAVRKGSFLLTLKQAGLGSTIIRETRTVRLPPKLASVYRKTEREFILGDMMTKWVPVKDAWLRRLAGGYMKGYESDHKTRELLDLLKGELKDQPCVVSFRFNTEVAGVEKALKEARIPCTVITGDTSRLDRAKRIGAFQSGKVKVLLVQAACVMQGINLARSNTIINFSRWPDGEINNQLMYRVVHPDKTEPVLILDIVTENTIDEDTVEAVNDKLSSANVIHNRILQKMKARNLK